MAWQFSNSGLSVLSGAHDASTTTITLAFNGAGFPASGNFVIRIDSELIEVNARSSNTLTAATRGFGGSVAAAHNDMALVQLVASAKEVLEDFAQVDGGQLGGSGAAPDVRGLRETGGPTLLTLGAVADGEYLKRDGTAIVGDTPSGGGGADESVIAGHVAMRV